QRDSISYKRKQRLCSRDCNFLDPQHQRLSIKLQSNWGFSKANHCMVNIKLRRSLRSSNPEALEESAKELSINPIWPCRWQHHNLHIIITCNLKCLMNGSFFRSH